MVVVRVMLVLGKKLVKREFGNTKEINNLEYPERINNKQDNKPPRIATAAGVP